MATFSCFAVFVNSKRIIAIITCSFKNYNIKHENLMHENKKYGKICLAVSLQDISRKVVVFEMEAVLCFVCGRKYGKIIIY